VTFKFSARSLRNLEGVHPDLVRVVTRALELSDVDFAVIEGRRTKERQAELVAKGASWTMASRHLTGHAVDLAPFIAGGIRWDWPPFYRIASAMKRAALDQNVPVRWGGTWRRLDALELPVTQASLHPSQADGPHFELPRDVYP
jgi:peptidoglycan L-alanyl-D-glutamate endopeptidase CwlK